MHGARISEAPHADLKDLAGIVEVLKSVRAIEFALGEPRRYAKP